MGLRQSAELFFCHKSHTIKGFEHYKLPSVHSELNNFINSNRDFANIEFLVFLRGPIPQYLSERSYF